MKYSLLLLPLLIILLLGSVRAYSVSRTAYIFGVEQLSNGSVIGVPSQVTVRITNGSGQVFVAATPLVQTSTQAQAIVSTYTACFLLNFNCNKYNFYFNISSSSPEVGGPSEGAALSVLVMAGLLNVSINPSVAMTGVANPDGSIGLIGDASQKSEAAALVGIKEFLYPLGNNISSQAQTFDYLHGEKTIPVSNIFQAFQIFTGYKINITPVVKLPYIYQVFQNYSFQQIENYQSALLENLSNYSGFNSEVYQLIAIAKAAISKEKLLASQNLAYVASSLAVNTSLPDLIEAQVLAYNLSLPSLISQLNSSKQVYINKIIYKQVNSSTEIFLLTGLDRIHQGEVYLSNAINDLNNNLYSEALTNYALALTKFVTAVYWDQFLSNSSTPFNQSSLQNLAYYYFNLANSYYYYSQEITSYSNPLSNYYLNESQYNLQNHNYVYSLFESLNSIAESQLAIESVNLLSSESSAEIIPLSLYSDKLAIYYAEKAGSIPILGITNYLLANSSYYSNYTILEFSSFSRVYAQFEEALVSGYEPFYSLSKSPISYNNSFNLEGILLFTLLGIAIGAIVEGLIYEFFIIKKIKSNLRKKHGRV
ncbi:MAG: hypothetical protein QXJ93_02670 [Candidatus Rehaiarchaeum fermentans]|nr:hypothetical protein [Candidatus Rehaiarchaeum fermentans]